MKALEVEGLVAHRGGRRVLDGVSLSVRDGASLAVLGPNGAGKTTAFSVIAGELAASAGRVRLFGREVDGWPLHRRARAGLGYLPQQASVFRGLTVEGNLRAALELSSGRRPSPEALDGLLIRFGLAAVAKVRGGDLSGGERRRTELARLWATNPRVLLLDEPFAGLDPQASAALEGLLASLSAEGRTLIFSDHRPARALALAERACVLMGGAVAREGPSAEVGASDVDRAAGFAEPAGSGRAPR